MRAQHRQGLLQILNAGAQAAAGDGEVGRDRRLVQPSRVALVRAVGPTLSEFGLTGLLADPQLVLISSTGATVASNDNWGGAAALSAVFTQVGAFPLPAASLDAAVVTSLQPGPYTAQVTGASGGTGTVLLEAYDADTTAAPTAHFINVSSRGFADGGQESPRSRSDDP